MSANQITNGVTGLVPGQAAPEAKPVSAVAGKMTLEEELQTLQTMYKNLGDKLESLQKLQAEAPAAPKRPKWVPKEGTWVATLLERNSYSCSGVAPQGVVEAGLLRETQERAERASVELRRYSRLLAYRDEFAPDYVIPEEGKQTYVLNCTKGTWHFRASVVGRFATEVCFPEGVARRLADKLNSGEVEL